MEQTKSDRLRQARVMAGYQSASHAARAMGVSTPTYIHHENGTRDFGEDAARIYAKRFHVNLPWLLLGEGDAIDEIARTDAALEKVEERLARDAISPEERKRIEERGKEAETKSLLEKLNDIQLVPLISRSFDRRIMPSKSWYRHVGLEDRVRHDIYAYFGIPKYMLESHFGSGVSTTILFAIDGDAMAPTFQNGDIIVVGTSEQDFTQDGIYLLSDGTSVPEIRRVQKILFSDPVSVRITGDNPTILPIEAPVADVQFIGKACGKFSVL